MEINNSLRLEEIETRYLERRLNPIIKDNRETHEKNVRNV